MIATQQDKCAFCDEIIDVNVQFVETRKEKGRKRETERERGRGEEGVQFTAGNGKLRGLPGINRYAPPSHTYTHLYRQFQHARTN